MPKQEMFNKYLESRGINPQHFETAQNNPLIQQIAAEGELKVDVL